MSRKSKRDIERAVEDLDCGGDDSAGTFRFISIDPKTGVLFDGIAGNDVLTDPPEDDQLIASQWTVCMTYEEAMAQGREVLEVVDEAENRNGTETVVSVRADPDPEIPDGAVTVNDVPGFDGFEDCDGPTIDFAGTNT